MSRVQSLLMSVARQDAKNVAADPDARAYINAVRNADGGRYMEVGVQRAIDAFITGCKADGIWSAIKAGCILAGARTLAGALVPLVGSAPTNNNFVSGDYNRKTGLVGDGTTKFLDTNTNNNSLGQNDAHMAAYVSSGLVADAAARGIIGTTNATGSSGILKQNTDVILTRLMHSGAAAPTPPVGLTGLVGGSRNASASYSARGGGVAATASATSQTPQSESILVFRTGTATGVHRCAFYSAGNALSLALLDARVTALINAIGAAIP